MTLVTVREFATLTTATVEPTLDRATIPEADFDWLALSASRGESGASSSGLINLTGRRTLKVQNYVGILRTPSGLDIEILPKHTNAVQGIPESRRLLLRLIAASHTISPRVSDAASLQVLQRPFTEWMAASFLGLVADLVKRGLRRDYLRVETQERYLRGRLDVARQLRAGPTGGVTFHVRHDVFSLDRPENRLIKTAVDQIVRSTRISNTWRLGRELADTLSEIPVSLAIQSDLDQWRDDRLMAHYAPVRSLCEFILTNRTPYAVTGQHTALSMLFPMERLFEAFVERSVRAELPADFDVQRQRKTHRLCRYQNEDWFDLKPDIVVQREGRRWVLDAKWKILCKERSDRFNLSQSDLYQLNAYGQTYLSGDGDLFLVYPRTPEFPVVAGPLCMRPHLRVHILAIDLETGHLELMAKLDRALEEAAAL